MIDYDQLTDFAGYDGHSQPRAVFYAIDYGIELPLGDIWEPSKIVSIPEGIKAALKAAEARALSILNDRPAGLAGYNDPPRPSFYPAFDPPSRFIFFRDYETEH